MLVLTFRDLLETFVSGSHDCDLFRCLDRKRAAWDLDRVKEVVRGWGSKKMRSPVEEEAATKEICAV